MNSPSIISTVLNQQSVQVVEALKSRIKQLEEQLAQATQPQTHATLSGSKSDIETATTRITKRLHVQYDNNSISRSAAITRGIMNKTRLLGQSYWMSGLATLVSRSPVQ